MKAPGTAFLCLILPLISLAQGWKPYKIDDSVQVYLPVGFKKADTLGQIQITAPTTFGFIQITKQPDNPKTTPDIEKLRHLNLYYSDFIKRIRTSAKSGIVLNEKDTTLFNLHVKDFTLAVDSGSGKQLRNFRILHENGATYSFQYLYQDISAEYAVPESETFFKSISVNNSARPESQFTVEGSTTGKAPGGNQKRFIWIAVGMFIISILFIYIRNRRKG